MEFTEPRRLYRQLAAELKQRIESGIYQVGEKLPAERYISEEWNVSRTVVREAIIMLEVEGYVEVRKGSGIHVISNQQKNLLPNNGDVEFVTAGPFELLQARQLIESNIAEFAATQVTRQDIVLLMEIQEHARQEDRFRDSQWDLKFHVQVALATQNSAMATIVEKMWSQRIHNPYWRKLHEHIDDKSIESWYEEHDEILKALIRKDPYAAKLAMWQHLENTKQMLFRATTDDFEFNVDRYMFSENPVVHLEQMNTNKS
ncbi:transcriptional regulator ExuR [Brenneria roseae subsp. roseae]|uniref:transcriptional regulator ExuR n=1 Tax=Brenneria roseae TaxID=1509241 RepID=UPI000D608E15|nr:transcriptional regulator ExuR [Brenneria roseae]PWC15519.1 transcriptional regulator ExuR [Brenneria roseae subsp. roseae]